MTYPVLSDIKARLGISGVAQDTALQAALNASRGAVENYCGYRWEYADAETRLFDIYDTIRGVAVFDVSDPGVLSYTGVRAWLRWEDPRDMMARDLSFRRLTARGAGPYQRLQIRGAYDFAEVTGVFGQGLTAPAEVSECVMLIAIRLFAEGTGQQLAVDDDVSMRVFQDDTINFLLRGWRRFR